MTPENISLDAASIIQNILKYIEKNDGASYSYVSDTHYERLKFTADYLEANLRKTDAIVDIGSHPYFLPAYLSLRGFKQITTLEIQREDDFELCPTWNFNRISLDIETQLFPFEDNSLDAVLMLEVYEHLYRRPNQVFRELSRILKPGGKLIISTPNGGSLPKYLQVLLKEQFGTKMFEWSQVYENLGHFSHIREYSLKEIREYLHNFNFSITYSKHISFHSLHTPYKLGLKKLLYLAYRTTRKLLFFMPILQNNIFLVAIKGDK